jgi:hypothetical protein
MRKNKNHWAQNSKNSENLHFVLRISVKPELAKLIDFYIIILVLLYQLERAPFTWFPPSTPFCGYSR